MHIYSFEYTGRAGSGDFGNAVERYQDISQVWLERLAFYQDYFYSINPANIIQLVLCRKSLNDKKDEAFQWDSFGQMQRHVADHVGH